jgi:hypothetical protein
MNEVGGNWTPEVGPITVTAGDAIIPLDAFTVYLEVNGVETPANLTAVKATVRERNWFNAPVVLELPMSVDGAEVSPAIVTVPNKVGLFWYDIQVTLADGQKPTIVSDSFRILAQTTVVA